MLTLQCSLLPCGWSRQISDSIFITTEATVQKQRDDLKTHLIAPPSSSFSQYYQQESFQPRYFFLQSAQLSPIILFDDHSSKKHSIEKHSQDTDASSYNLYRPTAGENPQFVDILPPTQQLDALDYYAMKPRKNKKYSAKSEKTKKLKAENLKEKFVANEEVQDHEDSQPEVITKTTSEETDYDSATEENDHEASPSETEYEELPQNSSDNSEKTEHESVEISAPSSRLDFQMHGNN